MNRQETKDRIISLLKETDRIGIDELIAEMEQGGFFTAPCSTDSEKSK